MSMKTAFSGDCACVGLNVPSDMLCHISKKAKQHG
jgi:hypothetical protein